MQKVIKSIWTITAAAFQPYEMTGGSDDCVTIETVQAHVDLVFKQRDELVWLDDQSLLDQVLHAFNHDSDISFVHSMLEMPTCTLNVTALSASGDTTENDIVSNLASIVHDYVIGTVKSLFNEGMPGIDECSFSWVNSTMIDVVDQKGNRQQFDISDLERAVQQVKQWLSN